MSDNTSMRCRHIYSGSMAAEGTVVSVDDGPIVLVVWDNNPGRRHPCIRQELTLIDENPAPQVRYHRGGRAGRDDRDGRDDRGDRRDNRGRNNSLVASV